MRRPNHLLFDFSKPQVRRAFLLLVFVTLLLAVSAGTLLVRPHLNRLALEQQINAENEASVFVAPPGILDPAASFSEVSSFTDELPFFDSVLPDPVAPEKILDPDWNISFSGKS